MQSIDFVSFMIGLLLGMIMMLLLVWASYAGRVFLFTYCTTGAPFCAGADYYNDPGDALANDPRINVGEILFLNSNNQMFYKRVPRTTNCIPEGNQTVHMKFPQYCSFSGVGISGTWKESAFNSNVYDPVSGIGDIITTSGSCIPIEGQDVTSGVPLLEWDPNPIS